ncbi:MAG: RNA-directed DNA polymerase [Planctomycetes bacterium]|nr:RNA-directed DNA polymerase [Planctomycetota bacterium]
MTSQFFANVLLDQIDHFIKEDLRVPGYVRYADDLVLFGDSKSQLWEWHSALQERLATLRLRLHPDKTHVRPTFLGLKFLGFTIYQNGRRVSQENIARFNRRIRHLHRAGQRGATGTQRQPRHRHHQCRRDHLGHDPRSRARCDKHAGGKQLNLVARHRH